MEIQMPVKKKTAYIMVTDHNPHSFVQIVNSYMADGWEIWGAPSTVNFSDGAGVHIQYCQAMIHRELKYKHKEKNVNESIPQLS